MASCLGLVPVPLTLPQHSVNVEVAHNDRDGVEDHVGALLLLVLAPEEERLPEQDQEADIAIVRGHLILGLEHLLCEPLIIPCNYFLCCTVHHCCIHAVCNQTLEVILDEELFSFRKITVQESQFQ